MGGEKNPERVHVDPALGEPGPQDPLELTRDFLTVEKGQMSFVKKRSGGGPGPWALPLRFHCDISSATSSRFARPDHSPLKPGAIDDWTILHDPRSEFGSNDIL